MAVALDVEVDMMRRRNRTKKLLLMFGILALFAGRTNAAGLTAGNYRDMCESKTDQGFDQGFCYGYALGFMQGIGSMEIDPKIVAAKLYFADQFTPEQIRLAVVAYVDKHPEVSNQSVNVVFVRALLAANLLRVTRENTCGLQKQ